MAQQHLRHLSLWVSKALGSVACTHVRVHNCVITVPEYLHPYLASTGARQNVVTMNENTYPHKIFKKF